MELVRFHIRPYDKMRQEDWESLKGRPGSVVFNYSDQLYEIHIYDIPGIPGVKIQGCFSNRLSTELAYHEKTGGYLVDDWSVGEHVCSINDPTFSTVGVVQHVRNYIAEVAWDQNIAAHHSVWDLVSSRGFHKYPQKIHEFIQKYPRHWWALQQINPFDAGRQLILQEAFSHGTPTKELLVRVWNLAGELEKKRRDEHDQPQSLG